MANRGGFDLHFDKQDFVPAMKDILLSRQATKGIQEYEFEIRRIPFRFFDVGGQRSQRQVELMLFVAWPHFFLFLIGCKTAA